MVYTRTVKGKEFNFASSGKLYKDALVLVDKETGSLWTQVNGSCLRGQMKGARLTPVTSLEVTWAEWKKLYPHTLVLKKDPRIQDTLYTNYHSDPNRIGVAGSPNPDPRLPGKTLVVAVREGDQTLAYSFESLKKSPIRETKLAGRPLLVVYYANGATARVFDRRVNGRLLSFDLLFRDKEILLRDHETSTLWSPLTGQALEGNLAGNGLQPIQYMISYWYAWAAYNPGTRLED